MNSTNPGFYKVYRKKLNFEIQTDCMQAVVFRAVARPLIGGGGCIFIYSGYARLTSFEINFISKETS